MQRRFAPFLGALILLGLAAFAAAFGYAFDDPAVLLQGVLLATAGVAFVVAGIEQLAVETVEWFHLVGLGQVLVGVSMGSGFLVDAAGAGFTTNGIVSALFGLIAGAVVAAIGVDIARGGIYLTVDPNEPGW